MVHPKLPDKVVVVGDYQYGIRNKGRAHTLLSVCRHLAGKLAVYEHQEQQADGCLIVASKIGNSSIATIVTPELLGKKKKKKPDLGGAYLVLAVGSEQYGFFVGKIALDGEDMETEFIDTYLKSPTTELISKHPAVDQEDVYINKLMLGLDDEDVIGVNTISEASWTNFCSIPNPHCPLAPMSGTIGCVYTQDEEHLPVLGPGQFATFRFHRRQYCSRRFGTNSYFHDKRDYIQLTSNSGPRSIGPGPAILAPRVGDDFIEIGNLSLSIACLNWEKRFYCTTEWADAGEHHTDEFLSGDQIFFLISEAQAGPMVIDSGYSTIETGDYLDGEFKFRDDTGEPYFVPWEHPNLGPFLDPESRQYLYAYNRPLAGLGARVFNTPLRMATLSNGAPDFTVPAPLHELFLNREHMGVRIYLAATSFLEGTFDKMGTVGTYTMTDVRHRVFSSAAVSYSGQEEELSLAANERLRLKIEEFMFLARAKQIELELPIHPSMSLHGNFHAYLGAPAATPSRETMRHEIYLEINHIRILNNLEPLTPDVDLEFSALIHAFDCAKNGLESHTGSDGSSVADRMQRTGYALRFELICEVGENVAFGQKTPQEAMVAWISSPLHWANMINPDWTDTGAAVYPDEDGNYYWVQVFGRRS